MRKVEEFLDTLTSSEWEFLIKKVYSYVAKKRKKGKHQSSEKMRELANKRWKNV